MKVCIPAIIFGLAFGGCASAPAGTSIAGDYAANPVREDPGHFQWADGRSRIVTTELTLTLYPDGSFATWQPMYFDGELVRFSGLATYDLKTNSRGSWSLADGRLRLHSVGPSNTVTEMALRQLGRSIAPEDSEATASRRHGHWVIRWQGTEYLFKGPVPVGPPPVRPTLPAAAPPPTSGPSTPA